MEYKKYWFLKGLKIFLLMVVATLVMGGAVMFLWNWLMPDLFGLDSLSFWQALGLLALSKLLFGFGGTRGGWKGKSGGRQWKSRMKDKWQNMNEEERAAFKEQMKHRCGNRHSRKEDATETAPDTFPKEE